MVNFEERAKAIRSEMIKLSYQEIDITGRYIYLVKEEFRSSIWQWWNNLHNLSLDYKNDVRYAKKFLENPKKKLPPYFQQPEVVEYAMQVLWACNRAYSKKVYDASEFYKVFNAVDDKKLADYKEVCEKMNQQKKKPKQVIVRLASADYSASIRTKEHDQANSSGEEVQILKAGLFLIAPMSFCIIQERTERKKRTDDYQSRNPTHKDVLDNGKFYFVF